MRYYIDKSPMKGSIYFKNMATTKAKKAEKTVETKAPGVVKAAPKAAKSDAFAVFTTGGKQYKVQVGDSVKIEKIIGDHKVGGKVTFDSVLLLDTAGTTTVGAPYIAGSKVQAEITEIGRDPKIMVIHYKQKSKYFKKYGHRQPFFTVAITAIA
jgi:large subunit ribosomal protein L21